MEKDQEKNQEKTGGDSDMAALRAEAQAEDGGEAAAAATEVAPPEFPGIDPVWLSKIAKMGFRIIAKRQGDHWELAEDEARQLGELGAPVADKWLPAIVVQLGPEIALISCFSMIIADRIGKGNAKEKGDIDHPGAAGSGKDYAS